MQTSSRFLGKPAVCHYPAGTASRHILPRSSLSQLLHEGLHFLVHKVSPILILISCATVSSYPIVALYMKSSVIMELLRLSTTGYIEILFAREGMKRLQACAGCAMFLVSYSHSSGRGRHQAVLGLGPAFTSALDLVSLERFVSGPTTLGRERGLLGTLHRTLVVGFIPIITTCSPSPDRVLALAYLREQENVPSYTRG